MVEGKGDETRGWWFSAARIDAVDSSTTLGSWT